MTISIGQKAPDFTLVDTDKNEVSISQFNGKKVLLLFFPGAFSGVCTTELCAVRDSMADFNNLGAQVIGVSTDTFFALKKFKELNNLDFILLSDYNKEVCGLYGAQYDNCVMGMKGTAKRSAFVIDENGDLVYSEILESAGDLPNFDKIKAALA
jgi:glutaredoxin-dependent peroxiredoxin